MNTRTKILLMTTALLTVFSHYAVAEGDRGRTFPPARPPGKPAPVPPTDRGKTRSVLFTPTSLRAPYQQQLTFAMQTGPGTFLPKDGQAHKALIQDSLTFLMAVAQIEKANNFRGDANADNSTQFMDRVGFDDGRLGPRKKRMNAGWELIYAGKAFAQAYVRRGDQSDAALGQSGADLSIAERGARFVSLVALQTAKLPPRVRKDVFGDGLPARGAFLRFAHHYALTIADGLPLTWRLDLGTITPILLTDRM